MLLKCVSLVLKFLTMNTKISSMMCLHHINVAPSDRLYLIGVVKNSSVRKSDSVSSESMRYCWMGERVWKNYCHKYCTISYWEVGMLLENDANCFREPESESDIEPISNCRYNRDTLSLSESSRGYCNDLV